MCVLIFRKICAVKGRPLAVAATAIDPKRALIKTLQLIRENVPEDIKNWPCFSATGASEMTIALKTDLKALSLWLRMQGDLGPVMNNLGDLHYYMNELNIAPVPFLNPGYERKLALDKRLSENLLPKRTSTIAGWKAKPWTIQEAKAKSGFLKTEDEEGRQVSSVGVFLEERDMASRDQGSADAAPRLVVSGTADVQRRSNVDIDHLDPFANIRTRIEVFLAFVNQEGAGYPRIAEALTNYPDYFRKKAGRVVGTTYLSMSHYNCIDNLWFLEHGPNREKSDHDPISWIEDHDFFKGLLPHILKNPSKNAALTMRDVMNVDSFIYSLGYSDEIKEEFRGEMLGSVIQKFVWSQPDALRLLVKGEETRDSIKFVLDSVGSLFYADAFDVEAQDEVARLFEEMVVQLDQNAHQMKRDFWEGIKGVLHSPARADLKEKLALTPTPQRKARSRSDSGSDDGAQSLNPQELLGKLEEAAEAAEREKVLRLQAESTIADKDALVLEEQAKREVADAARAKAEAKAAKLAAKLRALGIDPEEE